METSSGTVFAPYGAPGPGKIASYLLAIIRACKAVTEPNDLHNMAACTAMDLPSYPRVGSRQLILRLPPTYGNDDKS